MMVIYTNQPGQRTLPPNQIVAPVHLPRTFISSITAALSFVPAFVYPWRQSATISLTTGQASSLFNGLQAYYALENTSDSSGSGLTLTNGNGVTFTTGKVNNAATLVATSNQTLSHADNAAYHMGTSTDFSLSMWFKTSNHGSIRAVVYGNVNSTGWGFTISNQVIAKVIDGVGNVISVSTPGVYDDGNWHLAILTASRSGNLNLYVDNSSQGTPASMSTIGNVNNLVTGLGIGDDGSGLYFDGQIDEVGIWSRVLTSQERSDLWNSGSGTTLSSWPSQSGGFFKRTNKILSAALAFSGLIIKKALKALVSGQGWNFARFYYPGNDQQRFDFESGLDEVGLCFTAPATGTLKSTTFWLSRSGASGQTMHASLWSITGTPGIDASPNALLATSSNLSTDIIPDAQIIPISFDFAGTSVSSGTGYAISVTFGTANAFNWISVVCQNSLIAGNTDPPPIGTNGVQHFGGSWSAIGDNPYFGITMDYPLTKKTSHGLSGALSFIGALIKSSRRSFTGALSFAGSLLRSFVRPLSGSVSFSASLLKKTFHALSAAASFVGDFTKKIITSLSAAVVAFVISFTATRPGQMFQQSVSGSLSFVGSLTKNVLYHLAAACSFIGSIAKSTSYHLAAACSFVGSIVKKAITPKLANLSFAGAISTLFGKVFTGTASFIGTITKRTSYHLSAACAFVGSLLKQTTTSRSGAVSFAGAISKRIGKALSGAVSFVGATSCKVFKSMASAVSFIADFTAQGGKQLMFTASLAFSGALARFMNYHLTSSVVSFIGQLGRTLPKALSAAVSFAGSFIKRTGKVLTAAISFIGLLTSAHIFNRILTGSISFIGAITKRINKLLSAIQSFVGTCLKYISTTRSAAVSFTGQLVRALPRSFSASISFAGNIFKQTHKSLSGTISLAGQIGSILAKIFAATLSFTGDIARSIYATIQSAVSFIVAFAPHFAVDFEVLMESTLSFTGSIFRRIGHVLKISAQRILQAFSISTFREILGISTSTSQNPPEIKIKVPGDIDT